MEHFKPLNEITKPDERHALLDGLTGTSITLEDLHSALAGIELNDEVPEEIRSQFNVARNLALYTWFCYSFNPVAQLKGFILIEHALNIRDGRRDRSFKQLLKTAVDKRWITDAGFSHTDKSVGDSQQYCQKLKAKLPDLRNDPAHGRDYLEPGAVQSLAITADFINQLF